MALVSRAKPGCEMLFLWKPVLHVEIDAVETTECTRLPHDCFEEPAAFGNFDLNDHAAPSHLSWMA